MAFKQNVILFPTPCPENQYAAIIRNALRLAGFNVLDMQAVYSRNPEARNSVAVLNWFDEISGKPIAATWWYIKQKIKMAALYLWGCQVILVIHNKKPHNLVSAFDKRLFLKLRIAICKQARFIVILCDETRAILREQFGEELYGRLEHKVVKIPHPTYLGAYEEAEFDFRERFSISQDAFLFSFAGQIRPYKNIELVIDTARKFQKLEANAFFLIMGRCPDSDYLASLERRAADLGNLLIVPEFVPDEKMCAFVKASDALILPYHIDDSLNSGTCMLAFTYGKTVVSPRIGTVLEYPLDLTFSYVYDCDENETEGLFNSAISAYNFWRSDREGFHTLGAKLASLTEENNSVAKTSDQYREVVLEAGNYVGHKFLKHKKILKHKKSV